MIVAFTQNGGEVLKLCGNLLKILMLTNVKQNAEQTAIIAEVQAIRRNNHEGGETRNSVRKTTAGPTYLDKD